MEDHVTHFLLDLKDIDFTLSVTPAQLWQAGGGQHVKISVIETHGSELAGSDLGISCEASHTWKIWTCLATVYPLMPMKAIGDVVTLAAADATVRLHHPVTAAG
ncbi:hypothetical protein CABS01_15635 [Colletotrichum abscissum]|uniref:uncharacterized protein n=1 Tax=Colletotrichum abscissum TaxID=1671311 RepID=UPI0027D49158|nr:uncharacterized protein CABS01_15635 [Colletotrichum abscissum]KAK1474869.1 hypothetical protein CABS01_15635 [Colletotrichum abscissum]